MPYQMVNKVVGLPIDRLLMRASEKPKPNSTFFLHYKGKLVHVSLDEKIEIKDFVFYGSAEREVGESVTELNEILIGKNDKKFDLADPFWGVYHVV